ncbi:MAG: AAA family ATPase [Alphaproteobacteria bacterium]|nr:AAA family ATPase [Alphaproteobacteria bacterium]
MKYSVCAAFLIMNIIGMISGFSYFANINERKRYSISKPRNNRISSGINNENNENNETPIRNPDYIPEKNETILSNSPVTRNYNPFKPKSIYNERIRRLNSKNQTERDYAMIGEEGAKEYEENLNFLENLINGGINGSESEERQGPHRRTGGLRIVINRGMFNQFTNNEDNDDDDLFGRGRSRDRKSDNFEVVTKYPVKFADIGGFDKIKVELAQCVEFLSNFTKYAQYNVRVPKGLILEGPPGNGKTLLAKALAGEARTGFIAVSGSEFQDKYVGVGSSRVRELFSLAKKNVPCIIFIDEIDAIGRKRSGDGESSSNERDSTLNELLVQLDGFKNNTGIFLVGATNRADLLDPALVRPGRIDKRIFIGLPDAATREAILNVHTKGKPYDNSIIIKDMVDLTMGLSAAQIENLLNEAMLNALRYDRDVFTSQDVDIIMNKMMAGWQPTDHQFTSDIIDHIALHEMGHAVMGLLHAGSSI